MLRRDVDISFGSGLLVTHDSMLELGKGGGSRTPSVTSEDKVPRSLPEVSSKGSPKKVASATEILESSDFEDQGSPKKVASATEILESSDFEDQAEDDNKIDSVLARALEAGSKGRDLPRVQGDFTSRALAGAEEVRGSIPRLPPPSYDNLIEGDYIGLPMERGEISGLTYMQWHGFCVCTDNIPMLDRVIARHPESFKDISLRNLEMRSFPLNVFANFLCDWDSYRVRDLNPCEIQTTQVMIADLEELGMNLDWLKQRLEPCFSRYSLSVSKDDTGVHIDALQRLTAEIESRKLELAELEVEFTKVNEFVTQRTKERRALEEHSQGVEMEDVILHGLF